MREAECCLPPASSPLAGLTVCSGVSFRRRRFVLAFPLPCSSGRRSLRLRWGVWAAPRSSEVGLGSAGPRVSGSLAVVLSLCRCCVSRLWLPLFVVPLPVRSLLGLLWACGVHRQFLLSPVVSPLLLLSPATFSGHRRLAGAAARCVFCGRFCRFVGLW